MAFFLVELQVEDQMSTCYRSTEQVLLALTKDTTKASSPIPFFCRYLSKFQQEICAKGTRFQNNMGFRLYR